VTVGSQKKYSNMVKGRNHDQAFDETLEFVLAAGGPTGCSTLRTSTAYPAQPCMHPLLMLHKPACIHCSFQSRNVFSIQKRPFCSGNLNSETPGDSENMLLRWGDVLARAAQPCMHALLTLHKVHQV